MQSQAVPLRLWDLSLDLPTGSSLELRRSTAREGEAHLTTRHAPVYLFWGRLEEALERFADLESHARWAASRLTKALGPLRDHRFDTHPLKVMGHEARRMEVAFRSPQGVFGWGPQEVVTAVLVHCPESGRYLVLFTSPLPPASLEALGEFEGMARSLRCHAG